MSDHGEGLADSGTASKRKLVRHTAASAFAFVLAMGIVNLFGDVTYEGGASINGQFLGSLGASAAAISIIAGFGEFLGYSLRSLSGWTADKTGRYWPVTFVGYVINLFAVPAMALAGNWKVAGLLILAERIGSGAPSSKRGRAGRWSGAEHQDGFASR